MVVGRSLLLTLEITFDLLERAYTLTLEMAPASDGIHRRGREPMLNLQSVTDNALKQFLLQLCQRSKLSLRGLRCKANSHPAA